MTALPLTQKQERVLRCIVEHFGARGCAPSVREIMYVMGFKSPNGVVCHLTALVKKGVIRWDADGKARAIVVPELLAAVKGAAKTYLAGRKGRAA